MYPSSPELPLTSMKIMSLECTTLLKECWFIQLWNPPNFNYRILRDSFHVFVSEMRAVEAIKLWFKLNIFFLKTLPESNIKIVDERKVTPLRRFKVSSKYKRHRTLMRF